MPDCCDMTQQVTDIPTAGDKVDAHRDIALLHTRRAQQALHDLQHADLRDPVLNQVIGVNLKLADVHARLALAVARSTGSGSE